MDGAAQTGTTGGTGSAPRLGVVIVAAGRGLRMGSEVAKQWIDLAGTPVAARSVEAFRAALPEAPVVLVLPADQMSRAGDFPGCRCVAGGTERWASVRAGLEALDPADITHVLIHDAARPLVPAAMIRRVARALGEHPAAAPGLALADALWQVRDGRVTGSVPRAGLWRAQTPQGFALAQILAAHAAHPGGALDDVEVALAAGIPVTLVEGDEQAMKLTVPADLARAEALIAASAALPLAKAPRSKERVMDIRVGQGFDVHAFGPGEHVVLCGVRIPHDKALTGHSDADVGLHALSDAIYGALSEGDIGRHFPPSEAAWKGKDSMHFLEHAAKLCQSRGYRISQVDVTLICERPKITPHAPAMVACIAPVLGIAPDRVSVKATTSERLGFTGREEGIAAMAVATLIAD